MFIVEPQSQRRVLVLAADVIGGCAAFHAKRGPLGLRFNDLSRRGSWQPASLGQ
ncbi:MAG: hypothetical protein HUU20_04330 [Pirellulales bacterium]|nr:hypothetical protein [Pirellulales bacterium]